MPKHFTLYKHYNNSVTTPKINSILVWFWRFAGNMMTSLQLANWTANFSWIKRLQPLLESLYRWCRSDVYWWTL